MTDTGNPHPYNEPKFTEAEDALVANLTELLDELWVAGASIASVEIALNKASRQTTEFPHKVVMIS